MVMSMFFPPLKGGKNIGHTQGKTMNKNTDNDGTCSNSHCLVRHCKGECERDYHFQALKVVRKELEEIKGANELIRAQKEVL